MLNSNKEIKEKIELDRDKNYEIAIYSTNNNIKR
jgi:hypothetical protein